MVSDATLITLAFEPLIAAAKGNARALVALAGEARRRGDSRRCHQLTQDALELRPDDPEIVFEVRDLLARTVPSWHFPMMQDDIRNQAFLTAIERAVRPDMLVLDIGSGSGLLSMMAARAGAREVHSCEMNPVIATIAEQIIRQNGYADKVTIHASSSHKLDADADLGGRADLVISEIIGKDFVCEHVLPSMQDAVRRLAKPDARFIPQGGDIRVALAYYAKLEDRKVGEVCGFDLSPFNQLSSARFNVQVNDPALSVRGGIADLFAFDFASAEPQAERVTLDLVASGGTVNGVVQWFRLQMDEFGSFENHPGPDSSRSWALIFYPFAEPIDPNPGDRIGVVGSIANNRLRIRQA
jgi:type II protein arginine methyltransferase